MASGDTLGDVVVVPLKDFARAKSRLRPSHGDEGAAAIARRLAAGVLSAIPPRPCVVVCDDRDVADFARNRGADVLWTDEPTLNGAVTDAYRRLGASYERVIIAHADLVDPTGLGSATFAEGATIVTDDRGDGTNVLVIPTRREFRFFYGPESAERHREEAVRRGLAVHVVRDSPWRFDVDGPDDLDRAPDSI
jgi:2-phospho-L-lactate/phosphoenolpyruvate guanylyltransferase